MIRGLYSAATGMQAMALNIDVISNNLANVATTGFKKSRAEFQDLLYETLRAPGAAAASGQQVPTGIQIGHGTRSVAVQKLFSQGDLQHTKNQLDIAIEGDGFFQVLQPDGETAYTRAGSFKIDSEGQIVNPDGLPLEPAITIPTDAISVSIAMDGTVSVIIPGEPEASEIGAIELSRFVNPAGLNSMGRNLFTVSAASGDALTGTPGEEGLGTLAQGFLEMSNVSVVDEMVNMISAQRAYEINSKAVQVSDELLQMANNLRR